MLNSTPGSGRKDEREERRKAGRAQVPGMLSTQSPMAMLQFGASSAKCTAVCASERAVQGCGKSWVRGDRWRWAHTYG